MPEGTVRVVYSGLSGSRVERKRRQNVQLILFQSAKLAQFIVEQQLTPRQLAQATGVSESSIKRWCDAGVIATVRTAGGHRRIPLHGAMQFLRDHDHEILRPQLLGLPDGTRRGSYRLEDAAKHLGAALEQGDEQTARQIVFELYLDRHRLSEIGDAVIAPAFVAIGHRWEVGDVEVFQERRAFELMRNLLHELRLSQSPLPADAKLALGGTTSGDSYALAPILVELVLRELGFRACFLGASLPIETLEAAITKHSPRLFWLSLSHLEDEQRFLEEYHRLSEAAGHRTALVVGGRGLHEGLRRQITYAAYCETLQHLETFGATLLSGEATTTSP